MKKHKPLHEVVTDVMGPEAFAGKRVLDVGCGKFKWAVAIQAKGGLVMGVDKGDCGVPPEGIVFTQTKFLDWQPKEGQRFDVLYLDKVAMFMPTDELFKKIEELGADMIAVRAMYAYPNPDWDPPKPWSLTAPEDWMARFEPLGYRTVYHDRHDFHGPDLQGTPRLFHVMDYIATKA